MNIYTRTGDSGTTSLFGGRRVGKSDPRIVAYGTVDELNAQLGVTRSENTNAELERVLHALQEDCFVVGADLASPDHGVGAVDRVAEDDVTKLEQWIDRLSEGLPELHQFILPGGTRSATELHVARGVCRRAERHVVELLATDARVAVVAKYLNRMSDLLFVMARYANHAKGRPDVLWSPRG